MARAAILPSWTASTTSPPLRKQSPPAKRPGMLVAPVARSTTIRPRSHFNCWQRGDQVEQRFLTECLDDHVGGQDEVRSGKGRHSARARDRILELGPQEFDALCLPPLAHRRGSGCAYHSKRMPSDWASWYS